MSSKNTLLQASGRWVRVGVLSVSTLAPLITTVVERLRAQREVEQVAANLHNEDRIEKVVAVANDVQADLQERLQSVGATLADVLSELRGRSVSTNQDLLKRSSELTDELKERGSKFSQVVAERSSEVSHQLAKQGRKAQKNLVRQDRDFWIALGFGFGLTAAGIITFVLVRRRLQHTDEIDELSIQLPIDVARAEVLSSQPRGDIYAVPSVNGYGQVERQSVNPAGVVAVADAAFVGVSSTKLYYPVETPLDQLADKADQLVDVIYFTSEKEAQVQGFVAAQV